MGFRLVPNSVKWNDLERRNSSQVISLNSVAFGAHYVKVIYDTPILTNRKSYMSFQLVPKTITLNDLERRNGLHSVISHNLVNLRSNP